MTNYLVKRLRDMVEASKIYDDDITLASIIRVIKREELLDESEVKPRIKQKMWVNVYPDHCCGAYHEKRHADEMAAPHRIGCVQVEIDIEEGEGL